MKQKLDKLMRFWEDWEAHRLHFRDCCDKCKVGRNCKIEAYLRKTYLGVQAEVFDLFRKEVVQ